jgi:hypothetical protein
MTDIIVTEHGMVSILRRRDVNPPSSSEKGQSVFIGSVFTMDSLREVLPFSADDNIFQLATPDGELAYGNFKTRPNPYFRECTKEEVLQFNKNTSIPSPSPTSCVIQNTSNPLPICVKKDFKSTEPCEDVVVGSFCKEDVLEGCIYRGADGGDLPIDYPNKEIHEAGMLGVPYSSLLNGNLQSVPEEKVTQGEGSFRFVALGNEDRLCPFSDFRVQHMTFNFVEIGKNDLLLC